MLVRQYLVKEDGTIFGGINGVNTLRYSIAVNPAVIEITEDEFNTLDKDLSKYMVVGGRIVEDLDWTSYDPYQKVRERISEMSEEME